MQIWEWRHELWDWEGRRGLWDWRSSGGVQGAIVHNDVWSLNSLTIRQVNVPRQFQLLKTFSIDHWIVNSWNSFFFSTSLCLFLVFLSKTSLLAIIDMIIAHCNSPFFSGLKTLSAYIHFYAFHFLVVWHDTISYKAFDSKIGCTANAHNLLSLPSLLLSA